MQEQRGLLTPAACTELYLYLILITYLFNLINNSIWLHLIT